MSEKLLKIEEVAVIIGVSTQTLNNWYRWKAINPEHELASILPEYKQEGKRGTRYWKRDDVWKLIEFRTKLPHGRNGILGQITQPKRGKKDDRKSNIKKR